MKGELTGQDDFIEAQHLQLEYWAEFKEFLEQKSWLKPEPFLQQVMAFAIGRPYFMLVAAAHAREKRISVNLTLFGPEAKAHFYLLHRKKREIEWEVGSPMEWKEQLEGAESQIVSYHDADPSNRQDWPTQHAWLREELETFHTAFAPRIIKPLCTESA